MTTEDPAGPAAGGVPPAPGADEDGDAIAFVLFEHRKLAMLLNQLSSGAGAGATTDRELWHEIVREASTHEESEEQVVYPVLRAEVEGGEALAVALLQEERELEEALAGLDGTGPGDDGFPEGLAWFADRLLAHAENEEREVLPRLQQFLDPLRLAAMGDALRSTKRLAPTRPHPRAPDTPPGNVVTGVAAAAVDRGRDALRRITDKFEQRDR